MATVKAFIIRDFKDAGTETNYTAGDTPDIDEGVYANYEVAGLVRKPTAADQQTKPSDAKPVA